MKRILSTDLSDGLKSKKFASDQTPTEEANTTIDSDLDQYVTPKPNHKSPKMKRIESVVMLSSDDESMQQVQRPIRPKRRTKINENFILLKSMFPNIAENVLLGRLNQNRYKKNYFEDSINYFVNFTNDVNNNDVLIIDNEEPKAQETQATNVIQTETQPTTSAAATASHQSNLNEQEINFIQSLFPNISRELAIEVINNVNTEATNQRESLIVDYIFNNQLNATVSSDNKSQEDQLASDLERVQAVIVDCDPTFLTERLNSMQNNAQRVEIIIAELVEKKTYPKLKDYLNKIKKQNELDQHLNSPLDIEEFLKIYPEPFNTFYTNTKEMSESYKLHCRVELMNRFDFIAEETIEEVLSKNKNHLTPAYRQLETAVHLKEAELKHRARLNLETYLSKRNLTQQNFPSAVLAHIPKIKFTKNRVSYKLSINTREVKKQFPDHLDCNFFRELKFIKNEAQIKAFILAKEQKRKQNFENAKLTKSLLECACCFDNELLDEDMLKCSDGHPFCKNCIKSYAETAIGDCKYTFKCIEDKCSLEYEMNTLSVVLEPNLFSKVLRNIQNEEIKKAGLENLESCQYCTYAAIIENQADKVFRCLNPECLKEICRFCKEPNHLPLRCSEIEKTDEVNMRTWIENKVTEAMIRQCHKCGKRFFKVEGCNMMHCVCGAGMCYICRKPISDYKHFTDNGCKQFTDVAELHQIEMEKAYKEANEIYLKEHPDSASISLKYDPKKILDELNREKDKEKQKKQQQMNQHNVQLLQMQQQLNEQLQLQLQQQQLLRQQLNRINAPNVGPRP